MEAIERFLATPVGSAVRVAIGIVIGYFVLDLTEDGKVSISLDELNTWVAGALAVALPVLIAYINPQDKRWGAKARTGTQ